MTSIIEYVRDAQVPLRADLFPADALALSCLIYVDFHALPGPRSPGGCLLCEAAQASSVSRLYRYSMASHGDRPLLEAAATLSVGRYRGRWRSSARQHSSTRPVPPTWSFAARTRARSGGWRMHVLASIFQRIHSGGPQTI